MLPNWFYSLRFNLRFSRAGMWLQMHPDSWLGRRRRSKLLAKPAGGNERNWHALAYPFVRVRDLDESFADTLTSIAMDVHRAGGTTGDVLQQWVRRCEEVLRPQQTDTHPSK